MVCTLFSIIVNKNYEHMKVTTSAIEELSKVLVQTENPKAGIRVFAQEGCCGPGLQMSIAENLATGDTMRTIDGVNFFIDERAEGMLEGVTIDFGPAGFSLHGFKDNGCGCC